MIQRRLVMIEWLDSQRRDGWQSRYDEPDSELSHIFSVGWLVRDAEELKVIAPHLSNEEPPQRCGEIAIPTCAIKSIKDIKVDA